ELAAGTVKLAERRMLLLILLDVVGGIGRQPGDVVDRADVAGLEAGRAPAPAIERVAPADLHEPHKALVLELAQALARPAVDGALEHVGHRILGEEPVPIDAALIDRQLGFHVGHGLLPSVPIPKFASLCGTLVLRTSESKDTSNLLI